MVGSLASPDEYMTNAELQTKQPTRLSSGALLPDLRVMECGKSRSDIAISPAAKMLRGLLWTLVVLQSKA